MSSLCDHLCNLGCDYPVTSGNSPPPRKPQLAAIASTTTMLLAILLGSKRFYRILVLILISMVHTAPEQLPHLLLRRLTLQWRRSWMQLDGPMQELSASSMTSQSGLVFLKVLVLTFWKLSVDVNKDTCLNRRVLLSCISQYLCPECHSDLL